MKLFVQLILPPPLEKLICISHPFLCVCVYVCVSVCECVCVFAFVRSCGKSRVGRGEGRNGEGRKG